ncbi:DegT/DnrJ/EryC1/StrS family aminotransferase [Candidatus Woesebacteria bacterium]|nr:DegT/DnrJ/EryC1/StrS family aminotransferase [Candidatus Woesebacteria bacterium]
MDTHKIIPVNRPAIPKNARKYLNQCVSEGWFSSEGPFVKRFEDSFARYLGVSYASTTSSGTAALHLALMALGVGPGDEVILPALTIASCYFAIWYTGAKAVPVDVDPEIYCIDPRLIEAKITKRTKVIMVVHLFGHPADMDPIMKIAKKHKLKVLEDAAEAHGAEYKGKKAGSIGDIAIFSFYANKIVTTGEGGMVVSNNKKYIQTINKLKTLNHSKTRFIHDGVGYNYLMSNMQAAVGLASLEEITASIAKKRAMAKIYNKLLSKISSITLPTEKSWAKSVYWMYAVVLKTTSTITQNTLMKRLGQSYGIQTRSFFYSPKTAFKTISLFQTGKYPVAESLEQTGLYLPSGLGNKKSEFQQTAKALKKILLAINR